MKTLLIGALIIAVQIASVFGTKPAAVADERPSIPDFFAVSEAKEGTHNQIRFRCRPSPDQRGRPLPSRIDCITAQAILSDSKAGGACTVLTIPSETSFNRVDRDKWEEDPSPLSCVIHTLRRAKHSWNYFEDRKPNADPEACKGAPHHSVFTWEQAVNAREIKCRSVTM